MKKHRCWWCNEMFEDYELIHSPSGWICYRCHNYLKGQE